LTGFDLVHPFADYIVLNVSSPNTANLRDLQKTDFLSQILKKVVERKPALGREMRGASKIGNSPRCRLIVPMRNWKRSPGFPLNFGPGWSPRTPTIDYSILKYKRESMEGGLSGKPIKEKANCGP